MRWLHSIINTMDMNSEQIPGDRKEQRGLVLNPGENKESDMT